jgi:hypothetical protein
VLVPTGAPRAGAGADGSASAGAGAGAGAGLGLLRSLGAEGARFSGDVAAALAGVGAGAGAGRGGCRSEREYGNSARERDDITSAREVAAHPLLMRRAVLRGAAAARGSKVDVTERSGPLRKQKRVPPPPSRSPYTSPYRTIDAPPS